MGLARNTMNEGARMTISEQVASLRAYRQELAGPLAQQGVGLVAVSPQTADGSLTMAEKHELEFPVLSDAGNQLARALGILTQPSETALVAHFPMGLI
jgi:Peroxiredoxin